MKSSHDCGMILLRSGTDVKLTLQSDDIVMWETARITRAMLEVESTSQSSIRDHRRLELDEPEVPTTDGLDNRPRYLT